MSGCLVFGMGGIAGYLSLSVVVSVGSFSLTFGRGCLLSCMLRR